MVSLVLAGLVKNAHMYVLVASDLTLHMLYELKTFVRLARPDKITGQLLSSCRHNNIIRTKKPT